MVTQAGPCKGQNSQIPIDVRRKGIFSTLRAEFSFREVVWGPIPAEGWVKNEATCNDIILA